MSPFKYGCIVEGRDFCARPALARQLAEYVRSGQNLVIQGERRIGKSSLVTNVIRGMKGYRLLYADFMDVRTVTDVCNQIADALCTFESGDSVFRKTFGMLAHLRPVITVDANTGMPTITVDAKASESPASINTMMNAVAEHVKGRKVCVVFDEFQDVLSVKGGERVLAMMRAKIQFLSETPFVFLGSARTRMLDIFMSPDSPFYKSATVFDVGTIPDDDFYRFISGRFATGDRKLPRHLFDAILEFVNRTSGDVQEYCDAIWQTTSDGCTVGESDVEKALQRIFAREGETFSTFCHQLTDIQFRVLGSLARLGGRHPLSGEFLENARVTSTATVKRSLVSLCNLRLIYVFADEYRFASPFFREWIRRK